jgi:hypothetical protein
MSGIIVWNHELVTASIPPDLGVFDIALLDLKSESGGNRMKTTDDTHETHAFGVFNRVNPCDLPRVEIHAAALQSDHAPVQLVSDHPTNKTGKPPAHHHHL